MRFAGSRWGLAALALRAPTLTSAILVAPSSNCAVQCGNVLSSLSGGDLTCGDSAYKTTVAGQTFQNCITCELNSTYVDSNTKQSDLQWLLYNLRYTVSYCLFGYPNNTNVGSSPCTTSFACGQIQNATEQYLTADNETTYGYCNAWIGDRIPKCQACLASSGNVNILSNYITVLNAGCQYQPAAGKTLSIQGSLFSSTPVNATNPSINTNLPTFRQSASRISLGARIGIAIGGIVLLAVLAGCCIVIRGRRRRRAYLARHARPTVTTEMPRFHDRLPDGTSPIGSSPQNESAKGLISSGRPWASSGSVSGSGYEESPVEKTYFSPYSSHYSSPISPAEGATARSRDWQGLGVGGVAGKQEQESQVVDEIEMAQLPKDERERIERARWAAQSGFSETPVIRQPMPVQGKGIWNAL